MSILKVVKLTDAELAEYDKLIETDRLAKEVKDTTGRAVRDFRSRLYEIHHINQMSTTEATNSVIIQDGCAVFMKEYR